LVGLKPTRGRIPLAPNLGDIIGGFVVEHVLSRTVRDSAAALDATAGPMPGDPYFPPPPLRPYLQESSTPPKRLRIAFSTENPLGGRIHPDCVEATIHAAKLCAGLGHKIEEAAPQSTTRCSRSSSKPSTLDLLVEHVPAQASAPQYLIGLSFLKT
jgi:amidase